MRQNPITVDLGGTDVEWMIAAMADALTGGAVRGFRRRTRVSVHITGSKLNFLQL